MPRSAGAGEDPSVGGEKGPREDDTGDDLGGTGGARPGADPLQDLGRFIREQREVARMSLRKLSEVAGISNPYLSQIERGLRKPSADILQQIAKGLRISAETLYVQAGMLDAQPGRDVVAAIMSDPALRDDQKQALAQIYRSFVADQGQRFAPPEL